MSRLTKQTTKRTQTNRENRTDAVGGRELLPLPNSPDHILLVLRHLEEAYGNDDTSADELATGEPLDGLLLTLLSQNTNDRNRDMAYEALRKAHPAWAEVALLKTSEIADLIRSAGLGDTKAARMKAILEKVRQDFGAYTLTPLLEWDAPRVRDYLLSIDGIGPKTVGCVMAFDLHMPAFPVDTHVARVSRRLGWVPEKSPPEKIQAFLEETVPPEYCRGGHLNIIEHGRSVCHARKPECGKCVLAALCKYASELPKARTTPDA